MLLGMGLFLGTLGIFITDCPLGNFDDDCAPIDSPKVLVLIIISSMFVVGGVISLQLTEMMRTRKEL